MTKIDERFLTLHPATEWWFAIRKDCERCANLVRQGTTEMRCKKVPMTAVVKPARASNPRYATLAKNNKMLADALAYCIDAREEGAPCGPVPKLFELSLPRDAAAADNSTVGKTDSSQKGT